MFPTTGGMLKTFLRHDKDTLKEILQTDDTNSSMQETAPEVPFCFL